MGVTVAPRPSPPSDGRTLVIFYAHPDDEACAVGGTLACHAARGVKVAAVCATMGERGIPPWYRRAYGDRRDVRLRELYRATRALKVAETYCLGYPDGGVGAVPPAVRDRDVRAILLRLQPQVVLTHPLHLPQDHPDHRAVATSVMRGYGAALRRGQGSWRPARLLSFIPPMARGQEPPAGGVWLKLDVTPWLRSKLEAFFAYRSQAECWGSLLGQPETLTTEVLEMVHDRLRLGQDPTQALAEDVFAGLPPSSLAPQRDRHRGGAAHH